MPRSVLNNPAPNLERSISVNNSQKHIYFYIVVYTQRGCRILELERSIFRTGSEGTIFLLRVRDNLYQFLNANV